MQAAALYSHRADRSNKVSPVQHGELSFALPEPVPKVQDSPVRPDIYYIIPDGYSSDAILQHGMNYANTMFTDALKSRGFEVIPHAQTNYHKTLMSLASTLNMRFYSANPTELSDQDYMRHVIAYNEVARYLLQLGYTNVQLLSGYLFPSALADINRDFTPSGPVDVAVSDNELATVLLDSTLSPKSGLDLRVFYRRSLVPQYIETTLLKPVAHELYNLLQRDQFASYDLLAPERFLDTLVELESIADMPEATFTLVHLLKPHLPVAFDNHGNVVAKKKNASPGSYLSQLEFLNRRFIEMVDKILESSRHQPVIIFQADHGSRHDDLQSDDERPMAYFDVYAAYLVPDQYSLDVPRPHTNINTFPLILNEVFDADFEFLDNHLIHLQAKFGFFSTQEDVTELLTHR